MLIIKRLLPFGLMAFVSVSLANYPYIGLGIGIDHFSEHVVFTDQQIPTNNGNAEFAATSPIGTAFGGYAFDFYAQWVAGLEFFGIFQNNNTTIISSNGSANFKHNTSYGLRLVPTYQIVPDADIHAIIGYTRTQVTLQDNGGLIPQNNGPVPNFTSYLNGFQVGLGTGLSIGYGFILRADMIYNGYANFTDTAPYNNANLSSLDFFTYNNSLNDLLGLVSLSYAF